jgi:hypothetical protein
MRRKLKIEWKHVLESMVMVYNPPIGSVGKEYVA